MNKHHAASFDTGCADFHYALMTVPGLVKEIGRDGFTEHVLSLMRRTIGAEYSELFILEDDRLATLGSSGERGCETLPKTVLRPFDIRRTLRQAGPMAAAVSISGIDAPQGNDICRHQRILYCAQDGGRHYCLRILRGATRDPLTLTQIETMRVSVTVMMSMVQRHADLIAQRDRAVPALGSVSRIERFLAQAETLSRREGQVCARILFGLSTCGIALDLGIGQESVMTYRKRAYSRLGIGSQRELMMWYLSHWNHEHARAQAATA